MRCLLDGGEQQGSVSCSVVSTHGGQPVLICQRRANLHEPAGCRDNAGLHWPSVIDASMLHYIRTGQSLPRRPVAKLQMPTLVLWAGADPALSQQLLKSIGDVMAAPQVHVLDGCSHWIPQDRRASPSPSPHPSRTWFIRISCVALHGAIAQ